MIFIEEGGAGIADERTRISQAIPGIMKSALLPWVDNEMENEYDVSALGRSATKTRARIIQARIIHIRFPVAVASWSAVVLNRFLGGCAEVFGGPLLLGIGAPIRKAPEDSELHDAVACMGVLPVVQLNHGGNVFASWGK